MKSMMIIVAIAAMAALAGCSMSPATASTPGTMVDTIVDELEVQRIPTEIETAVDAKDWERARSFFTDEIRVDFSSLSGAPPATIPADALIAGWSGNLGPKKQSHHQRGNALVTFDGDMAVVYSKGYAWNRMEGNGDPLWEVWGDYTHELVKTEEGWKVMGMSFVATHQRGNTWVRDTPSPQE